MTEKRKRPAENRSLSFILFSLILRRRSGQLDLGRIRAGAGDRLRIIQAREFRRRQRFRRTVIGEQNREFECLRNGFIICCAEDLAARKDQTGIAPVICIPDVIFRLLIHKECAEREVVFAVFVAEGTVSAAEHRIGRERLIRVAGCGGVCPASEQLAMVGICDVDLNV